MEKLNKTNKGICVKCAPKLLFGEGLMLNDSKSKYGLGCGSKKAITYANYASCQDIADLSFNKSRITGLIHCLMRLQITLVTSL